MSISKENLGVRFSIIVPIYNAERYLRECIHSILNQTFLNFELLLVIDGATDNSLDICKSFCDSRITIIIKDNGGVNSARRTGCLYAKGEYIVLVDSDDFVDINYLEHANALIDKFSPDILCFGFNEFKDERSTIKHINFAKSGYYFGESFYNIKSSFIYDKDRPGFNWGSLMFSLWSKIFKRDIYVNAQKCVPDNIWLGEDMMCMAVALNESQSLYVSDNCHYFYRTVENSITRTFNEKKLLNFNDLSAELLKLGFIAEKSISVNAFIALHYQLADVFLSSSSIKNFVQRAKKTLKYNSLWNCATSYKPKKLSLKEKILYSIIKNRFFTIFYLLQKFNKKNINKKNK